MGRAIIILTMLLACGFVESQTVCKFANREWEDVKSPIVKLKIYGKTELFMIDSGSAISIIDDSYKSDSITNFRYTNCAVNTISGEDKENGRSYKIPILNKTVIFYTKNLNPINKAYENSNIRIIGILGADFLIQRKAVIDYNKRELIINQ